MTNYNAAFFDEMTAAAKRSSDVVVPLLIDWFAPRSVCDVGCGTGTWLSAFKQRGVTDVVGLDGPWVNERQLEIDASEFVRHDLKSAFPMSRRFDLVISLEVAEHLPSELAGQFIAEIVKLADIAVFSAAVPAQGGTNHINEQWPEYWRDIFARHNYVPIDCIRPTIWNDASVDWYYAQNTLVYCASHLLPYNERLLAARERTNLKMLSLVHPRNYIQRNRWMEDTRNHGLRKAIAALPYLLADAASSRMRWLSLSRSVQ